MSGGEDDPSAGGNRTVFRPSPLAGLQTQFQPAAPAAPPPVAPTPEAAARQAEPAQPAPNFTPPPPAAAPPPPRPTGPRLSDEGFPVPATPRELRAPLATEAGPVLALAASVRSGRARIAMPDFQRAASDALLAYDRAITPLYPDETRRTARALLAATIDDIATNLPNLDGAMPWTGPSLSAEYGASRDEETIWKEIETALKEPEDNADIIELAHACIAAGYQGKFRTADNGRAQLNDLTGRIYAGIDHIKALSQRFVSPQWVGFDAPLGKVGSGPVIALAAAGALVLVLAVYALLRVMGGGA
ncbi:type IVB secretion system protein IcmH/DotU [Novosphingobium sp. Gsoil 351]|uniref:type IVB secretion system protein IcmH/DotU n=1 Tax=Novosphingobium sp. Gsoil 351 TaxID=2675225 RepID=UPI0018A8272A|nr:type IVB secretion system protein IcmH/DotU [Novosphingobium sp. Gsoil 351]